MDNVGAGEENSLSGLHHKRQARVDGVGGLLSFLGCHLCAQEVLLKFLVGLLRSGRVFVLLKKLVARDREVEMCVENLGR